MGADPPEFTRTRRGPAVLEGEAERPPTTLGTADRLQPSGQLELRGCNLHLEPRPRDRKCGEGSGARHTRHTLHGARGRLHRVDESDCDYSGRGHRNTCIRSVSYTHLRAHETGRNLVCRLLLEKKKNK